MSSPVETQRRRGKESRHNQSLRLDKHGGGAESCKCQRSHNPWSLDAAPQNTSQSDTRSQSLSPVNKSESLFHRRHEPRRTAVSVKPRRATTPKVTPKGPSHGSLYHGATPQPPRRTKRPHQPKAQAPAADKPKIGQKLNSKFKPKFMSDHAMFRQRVRVRTQVSYACIKAAINTGRVVDVDSQGRIGGDATDRDRPK